MEKLHICNFSSKFGHKYVLWIMARAFCKSLFQSTSFSEQFSAQRMFSFLFILHLLKAFSLGKFSYLHFLVKAFSVEKTVDHTEYFCRILITRKVKKVDANALISSTWINPHLCLFFPHCFKKIFSSPQ